MPIYHRLGEIPAKRHVAHRKPEGGLYQEELMGNLGFTGPSSLLYHLRRPTSVVRVESLEGPTPEPDPDPRVRHRHLRTSRLPPAGGWIQGRVPLLFNDDVAISFARPTESDGRFFRNAAADEYLFVHEGHGTLESIFGELPFTGGDQIVIPRGILHRLRLEPGPVRLLVVESRSWLRWPRRFRNDLGQLQEGAPYCERDIRLPSDLRTHDERGEFELIVKQAHGLSRVVLDHHPFDVIGWDGYYYPWSFSIHDFEPIVGRVHQPPPVHQFLEADGFVLCNFCPRPYDFQPDSIPAPYNHTNVGSDEVLFYASGDFMSRKGIEAGSLTLHPDGLTHGPHPGRYEASIGKPRTAELAVMIDTFQPLHVARGALGIEDPDYLTSWLGEPVE